MSAIRDNAIQSLLADAPNAVELYCAGHWALMSRLERDAPSAVASDDFEAVVAFLADVTVLKQPQRVDRELVADQLRASRKQVLTAMESLRRVVKSLETAIAKRTEIALLAQWSKWEGKVDTTSPTWGGIGLPTNMVLEGYLILEDFIPIRAFRKAPRALIDAAALGARLDRS